LDQVNSFEESPIHNQNYLEKNGINKSMKDGKQGAKSKSQNNFDEKSLWQLNNIFLKKEKDNSTLNRLSRQNSLDANLNKILKIGKLLLIKSY